MAARHGARCGLPSLSRTPWSWCCASTEAARCVLWPRGPRWGWGFTLPRQPEPQARAHIGWAMLPGTDFTWRVAHVTLGPVSPAVQNHPSAAHLWEVVFSDTRTPEARVLTLLCFSAGWPAAPCHPPLRLQGECAGPCRETGCQARVAAAAGPAVFVPERPVCRAAAAVAGGSQLSSLRALIPGQPGGPAAPGPSCPMS